MTTTTKGPTRLGGLRAALTALTVAATLLGAGGALEAQASDEAGVRRAALDYLEGFYEGSDEKLRRVPMSYEQMFQFAEGVRSGRSAPPEGAPKEVELLDVQDQTAVAKVRAWWGTDYLQMAKYDGRWMIVHVLWQSLD